MGLTTTFIFSLAAACSYLVNRYLLLPWGLEYLGILAFIGVIAAAVQFAEMVVQHANAVMHQSLGIYLPLITSNCAVLGVALLNARERHDLIESLLFGFGAALGFTLVMVLFAGVRERIEVADVPLPFRGSAIALVTAGLISLSFMGFSGLVKD